jgi:hypothetical protein
LCGGPELCIGPPLLITISWLSGRILKFPNSLRMNDLSATGLRLGPETTPMDIRSSISRASAAFRISTARVSSCSSYLARFLPEAALLAQPIKVGSSPGNPSPLFRGRQLSLEPFVVDVLRLRFRPAISESRTVSKWWTDFSLSSMEEDMFQRIR